MTQKIDAPTVPSTLVEMVKNRWRTWGSPPRVIGVDVARALAIIGMMAAHVAGFPELVWSDPTSWAGIVDGRSSILFGVIAGISVALLTRGAREADPETIRRSRLRLLGRAAVIFGIGLILELLVQSIAVILTVYGALFVFVIPFLQWSRRRLLITAGVLAVADPLVRTLLTSYWYTSGPGLEFLFFGVYPAMEWLIFLLIGLAIGRSDLTSVRLAATLVGVGLIGTVVGYSIGAVSTPEHPDSSYEQSGASVAIEDIDPDSLDCSNYDGVVSCYAEASSSESPSETEVSTPLTDFLFMWFDSSPHAGGVGEIIGSGGFAVAVIGLSLLAARLRRWLMPLAALGSMPLTVYTAHVISAEAAFRWAPILIGFSFWTVSVMLFIAMAWAWGILIGRGPLERFAGWGSDWMTESHQPSDRLI